MVQFANRATTPRNTLVIDNFLGVDFTDHPAHVDLNKSPNAPNMIRDVPGKVRKCMGYEEVNNYGEPINGYHTLTGKGALVHAGRNLYKSKAVLYSSMCNARSHSFELNGKLWILDGIKLLCWDGSSKVTAAGDSATVPLLTIGKSPLGGGTSYEALNLIQPKFTEQFLGTATAKVYQLSFTGLDSEALTVKLLTASGSWVTKTEGTDYTVNRTLGQVAFVTAPGASPVTGEDNVSITASRTVSNYATRINSCNIGVLYGINGAADRLFVSGNGAYPNYDWYSGQNDPSYWPDTGYSVLGSGTGSIVGYSILNNYLATHKNDVGDERNVIVREGVLVNSEPTFPVINTLQGPGAIAPNTFAYLATEPLFLTRLGVYAITQQDITGEKYAQNRSYYVDGKLLKEADLKNACAITHKDMYWLCLNGMAYILDGLQPMSTGQDQPYATRRYACFYRTNLPAFTLWQQDDVLYFGTKDGRICRFYSDPDNPASYNDCGKAIEALWETPDISGKLFYRNKTFRFLAARLASAVSSSVKLWGKSGNQWKLLRSEGADGGSEEGDFSTPKAVKSRARLRRVYKARFRVGNDALNEMFYLFDLALEYMEYGVHR